MTTQSNGLPNQASLPPTRKIMGERFPRPFNDAHEAVCQNYSRGYKGDRIYQCWAPPLSGKNYCEYHEKKKQQYQASWNARQAKAAPILSQVDPAHPVQLTGCRHQDLVYPGGVKTVKFCGKPTQPGYKQCEHHLEIVRRSKRKGSAKKLAASRRVESKELPEIEKRFLRSRRQTNHCSICGKRGATAASHPHDPNYIQKPVGLFARIRMFLFGA